MFNDAKKSTAVVSASGQIISKSDRIGPCNKLKLIYFAHQHERWAGKPTSPKAEKKVDYYQDKIDVILQKGGAVPRYCFTSSPDELQSRFALRGIRFLPGELDRGIGFAMAYHGETEVQSAKSQGYMLQRDGEHIKVYEINLLTPRKKLAGRFVDSIVYPGIRQPFTSIMKIDDALEITARISGIGLAGLGAYYLPGAAGWVSCGIGVLQMLDLVKPTKLFPYRSANQEYLEQSQRLMEKAKAQE